MVQGGKKGLIILGHVRKCFRLFGRLKLLRMIKNGPRRR